MAITKNQKGEVITALIPALKHAPELGEALARASRFETVGPDVVLLQEGQPSPDLVGLLSGRVAITRRLDQESIVIAERDALSLHGESALLPGACPSASVVSLGEAEIVRIPGIAFRETLEQEPDLTVQLLHVLLARLEERENQAIQKLEFRLRATERELGRLQKNLPRADQPRGIWGEDTADVLRVAKALARSSLSVILLGEPGTGKELLAEFIHQQSDRGDRPLVSLNCAALPETLAEAELFGAEKGAATGVERRLGLFREAHQATLFLDELAELSLAIQAKLLRALQEQRVRPIGGSREYPCDVRLICATNRNLRQEVEQKRFREDLYHRLYGSKIVISPLRDRRTDIPRLAEHFVMRALPRCQPNYVLKDVMPLLLGYRWPGNVREMEQAITEASVLALAHWDAVDRLLPRDFRPEILEQDGGIRPRRPMEPGDVESGEGRVAQILNGRSLRRYIRELETSLIRRAVQESEGTTKRAAQALGMSPQALSNRLKRMGRT